jgi:hypothetical protein
MFRLEREQGLPVYEPWRDFNTFVNYYCDVTGTPKHIALEPTNVWSYYQMVRIDKERNLAPDNCTFLKFVQERAPHENTRIYWRKLGAEGKLTDEMKDSYILFVNTFGLRPLQNILKRDDISKPHSRENSRWVPFRRGV